MKANEAPEKLYLDVTSKCGDTVFTIKNNDTDIEYTRTDAFIKKACEWFRTLDDKEPPYKTTEEFIEDFIKYMGGE